MLNDLRYAVRGLRRAPIFTAAAFATLALAIAVNTLVFTIINSLAFRPMPVRDAERIVRIYPVDATGRRHNLFSYLDYVDIAKALHAFEGTAVPRGGDRRDDSGRHRAGHGVDRDLRCHCLHGQPADERDRVRVALGADPRDVRRLVLADGTRVVSAGIAVGLGGAVAMTRLVAAVLPDLRAVDPAALGSAVAVIAAVGMGRA